MQTAQRHFTNHKSTIALLSNQTDTTLFSIASTHNKIEDVMEAISKLPEAQREVILLKYSNNLTIQEISEVCFCNVMIYFLYYFSFVN